MQVLLSFRYSEAKCLENSVEELLPVDFDRDTDEEPVQHVMDTYSSIRIIVQFGNSGCQLCSIITSAIMQGKLPVEIEKIFDEEESDNITIHTMLT